MTRNRVELWHVFAGGQWLATEHEGYAPVNVWVAEDKIRSVEYRHRASVSRADCPLCK